MKKFALALAPVAFALAGCGSTDDASTEAEADTVEVNADEALADVPPPAADAEANAVEAATEDAEAAVEATAAEAGQNAADVAARAQAAAAEATEDTQ